MKGDSYARSRPACPSEFDQYKKQAKELLKGVRSGDRDALDRLRRSHPRLNKAPARIDATTITLADAQLVIAREHGIDSWTKFVSGSMRSWASARRKRCGGGSRARCSPAIRAPRTADPRARLDVAAATGRAWVGDLRHDGLGNRRDSDSLPDARSIIAGKQHFESWDRFAAFR